MQSARRQEAGDQEVRPHAAPPKARRPGSQADEPGKPNHPRACGHPPRLSSKSQTSSRRRRACHPRVTCSPARHHACRPDSIVTRCKFRLSCAGVQCVAALTGQHVHAATGVVCRGGLMLCWGAGSVCRWRLVMDEVRSVDARKKRSQMFGLGGCA